MQSLQNLWNLAQQNPMGGTVNPNTLAPVTAGGWMIAVAETQNCFGWAGMEKAYSHAIANGLQIGWWEDKGQMYWDACIMEPDTARALELKAAHGQLAIYNIETKQYL